ncbi:hypothetical protein [Actinokineospora sp.]|uniref:hypothetical protein n=1 Tax=Actinokineospora sp. TaxID=1872133 RepID=UPI0040384EAF
MTAPTLADPRTDVSAEYLAELTRSPQKVEHYLLDPYVRHGARELTTDCVLRHTFVVLKPDAVVGRRLHIVVDLLGRNGFQIVGAHRFRFTPLLTREIWRYQFNIATRDRAEVVDLLLPAGDSVLLVVADERHRPGALPAACRLSGLKGSADPALRGPDDLRSVLNAPTTLFNFMHTADEPADVVRELALLQVATGHPVLGMLDGAPSPDVDTVVRELYAAAAAHDLDARSSWRRLGSAGDPAVRELARRAADGDPAADWSALLDLFPCRVPPADLVWDALSIATAAIASNVPGLRPIVPTAGPALWSTYQDEDSRS